MQTIQITGRLGAAPKVTETENKRWLLTFSVACTKRWRSLSGEKQERTTWYTCTAFHNERPKVSDYMSKGSLVYIAGEPGLRQYKTDSGEHRAELYIQVNDIELLDSATVRAENAAAST
jgi:single-strand DNA-binding protein